jgi:hypothetical protein
VLAYTEISHLFANAEELSHPFSAQHRIKLLMSLMLQKGDGGCGLNLEELLKNGRWAATTSHHLVAGHVFVII